MTVQPVLINGSWRPAESDNAFQATNPQTKESLTDEFPVSRWSDCDAALDAAVLAAEELRQLPASKIAEFLNCYADKIEANQEAIVELAHLETGLPKSPRLADGELPRTTGQLRQAAAAAAEESWRQATIDTSANIRSCFNAIGPVCVFGANNFPLAFGSASGGDFAAAIAAGNPVIAKANSSHPGVTKLFAEAALDAVNETGLPAATVQLLYRTSHKDGMRMVSDSRVGATGYTGSRAAGLKLKSAADAAGKPIYLELSSVNPVVILPGALAERLEDIADELVGSCLMGAGQFCTNPGLIVLQRDAQSEKLAEIVATRFAEAPRGTLLSSGVEASLSEDLKTLIAAGAEPKTPVESGGGNGFSHANVLLTVSGETFLENSTALQGEAFGNATLFVFAADAAEVKHILNQLEGNLTGCIYSATNGADDAAYNTVEPALRSRVGRLINDKMPTGVAVSPAMNHGGPFPATGHPGFTAVGIPASLTRFAMLACYDNVRPSRLPAILQDMNPGEAWRRIDGNWTQANA